MRIGTGYDIHRLVAGRPLILGGIDIPFEKGLEGHSDGDSLLHAIIDAILGAAALGDIGHHFPVNDDRFKGAKSLDLLTEVKNILSNTAQMVINIDSTVICEAPKLAPHIGAMRQKIADALQINVSQVSVKAKTNEKLGELGRGEAIAAEAVALIDSQSR